MSSRTSITRVLRTAVPSRGLHTTSAVAFPPPSTQKGVKYVDPLDISQMEQFQFDDTTSLGHLRLMQLEEAKILIDKVKSDRQALMSQSKAFKRPTAQIEVTQALDLATDPLNTASDLLHKRTIVAPLSALPLKTPESIKRFKLLAGVRWSPGRPGRKEIKALESDGEGYIKMAEDRFKDGRMNRKALSDTLNKLVETANDASVEIADLPLDPRHLLARQRKKKQRGGEHLYARSVQEQKVVGGVKGFPEAWLSKEAKA